MKFFDKKVLSTVAICLSSCLFAQDRDNLFVKMSEISFSKPPENFSTSASLLFWKTTGQNEGNWAPGVRVEGAYHYGEENNSDVTLSWTHFETESEK